MLLYAIYVCVCVCVSVGVSAHVQRNNSFSFDTFIQKDKPVYLNLETSHPQMNAFLFLFFQLPLLQSYFFRPV